MKKQLLKQLVYKVWALLPLILYCLLSTPSIQAAIVQITKVTGIDIYDPTYSQGDTLVISGNALEPDD